MMGMQPTAERLSVMLGLVATMLLTVPRYLAEGHDTRLSLIVMAIVVLAAVSIVHWRMLSEREVSRLKPLLRRLLLALLAGGGVMALWHLVTTSGEAWPRIVSHGAAAGLLLHVIAMRWKSVPDVR